MVDRLFPQIRRTALQTDNSDSISNNQNIGANDMNTGFHQKFMTLISTILLPKRLLICIWSTLWLGIAASPAYALPANEVETIYYSDSNYTEPVGSRVLTCSGGRFNEGVTSQFTTKYSTPCNQVSTPTVSCYVGAYQTTCPANICDVELFICL
jgi:hypothetical protein